MRKLKESEVNIPHGEWAYIVTHRTGGKYLYVSKRKLTMADVIKWQNDETIESILKVDVNMVIILD